jgi:hypothetical protein
MNISPTDTVCDGVGNPPVHKQDENNCTMLQGFEWYCPNDQNHWKRLQRAIPSLSALGITSIWIPPATKELSKYGNGYGIYDLWDLGEFNQKGSIATKWGTKTELVDLVECANAHGIAIIFDAVLNHKAGADHTEMVKACKVDPEGNRQKFDTIQREIVLWLTQKQIAQKTLGNQSSSKHGLALTSRAEGVNIARCVGIRNTSLEWMSTISQRPMQYGDLVAKSGLVRLITHLATQITCILELGLPSFEIGDTD